MMMGGLRAHTVGERFSTVTEIRSCPSLVLPYPLLVVLNLFIGCFLFSLALSLLLLCVPSSVLGADTPSGTLGSFWFSMHIVPFLSLIHILYVFVCLLFAHSA